MYATSIIATSFFVLSFSLAACDMLLDGKPTVEGSWQGYALVGEDSLWISLDVTQTYLGKRYAADYFSVEGQGAFHYLAARITVPCRIEGTFVRRIIQLEFQGGKFVLPTLTGKLSGRGDRIAGGLVWPEGDVAVTLQKQ